MSDAPPTPPNNENDAEKGRGAERARELIKPQKQSFVGSLWSSFLAGIVVVAPVGITVAIVYWFVTGPMSRLDSFVKTILNNLGIGDVDTSRLGEFIQSPGMGVLIAVVAIGITGALAKNFIGRSFIRAWEELFDTVPIVRNLYRFFKNVFETALQQSDRSFKEVALVEYPRRGAWVMAFVVGESKGEIKESLDDIGEQLTSIFIPTVPNPTSGFLLFVPRAELRPLAMTVEDAAKTVFSLGLVMPENPKAGDAVKRLEDAASLATQKSGEKKGFFGRKHKTNNHAAE